MRDSDTVGRLADAAMYAAKQSGKNAYRLATKVAHTPAGGAGAGEEDEPLPG